MTQPDPGDKQDEDNQQDSPRIPSPIKDGGQSPVLPETDEDDFEEGDPYNILSAGRAKDPIVLTDDGYIDIGRIEPGGSFGALALLHGKRRMGTTKALTRCHLIVLKKDCWRLCEKEIKERKISEMVQFIKRTPLFSKLSHTFLTTKLMPCFYTQECNRDYCVFKEGDLADKVFIIIKGEFICTKLAVIQSHNRDNNSDSLRTGKMSAMSNKNARKYDQHFVAYYYIGKMLGESDILSHWKG